MVRGDKGEIDQPQSERNNEGDKGGVNQPPTKRFITLLSNPYLFYIFTV